MRQVPAYVKYFLRYLSWQVSQWRHYDCDDDASLGNSTSSGRTNQRRQNKDRWLGTRTTRRRTLWSLEVQVVQPWIFERGEKPARVTPTIEALVVVVMGLKLFFGDDVRCAHAWIQMMPSFTHNRGNRSR